jgi:hypothetical protein
MKLVRVIIIAAGVVVASGLQAHAEQRAALPGETCSLQSSCVASCVAPRPNETCQQECLRYRNTCVRTGTWQGRRWTISGAMRQ